MTLSGNKDERIRKRELENGRITYRTLADHVGDMVLCNDIADRYGETMELVHGCDEQFYNEDYEEITQEEAEKLEEAGQYITTEPVEVYQFYIISDSGAELLKDTNELVYYDDELNLYVWGITHFGTGWDYVFTDINIYKGAEYCG